ncbi:hypothetical protein [Halonotius roseus]|uniref:Uncharacterized protein n=1 Tax=Halonotius roseus TaxID=2511997 RepID=A0A544QKR6_9EURY|nr:hypothetical protein [Halonotius roseus]TQQ78959.1 hypothetical protein EWF95_12570 [Halonotius roseus]
MERSGLRYTAGALALAVAAIHVYWGFPRLVLYLQVGRAPDPRPFLFVGSAVLIFLGIARVLDGRNERAIYLAGIALMATYIVGYGLWHTGLEHGGFWPWGPEPISHSEPAWQVLIDHMRADQLGVVSKLLEATLAGVLTVLYRRDHPNADTDDTAVPAIVRGE